MPPPSVASASATAVRLGERRRPMAIRPMAKPAIVSGIVITTSGGPRIDASASSCTRATTRPSPATPSSRSNHRARLSTSHHAITMTPIRKGPKALAIQIIEGPFWISPGTNRMQAIAGSSRSGIHVLSGLKRGADAA